MLRSCAQQWPTALDELRIRVLELRRHHDAIRGPLRATRIAETIDRRENFFRELSRLLQYRVGKVARVVSKTVQSSELPVTDELMQDEAKFFEGSFVHG